MKKILFPLKTLIFCVTYFVISHLAIADDAPKEQICAGVAKIDFPKKDLPTSKDKKTLEDCSPRDLYYGINTPVDYGKARKCAFIKFFGPGDSSDVLGGADILTMIYANGKGVKRNVDLATKVRCDMDTSYGTNSPISIRYLQHLKKIANSNFNICAGYVRLNVRRLSNDKPRRNVSASLQNLSWLQR
jgi:hypothetical protein